MKKTSKPAKLTLNKTSIAILNREKMMHVAGGNNNFMNKAAALNIEGIATLSILIPPICPTKDVL
ncbi:MAG TPA: class I lanthipeptide [Panacibacter sp.]|nr:class I lanthipeptide [Panacibacter sp.]